MSVLASSSAIQRYQASPATVPLMSPKKRPSGKSKRRRKRSEDPFLDILVQLVRDNGGLKRALCGCADAENPVCDCIFRMARKQLQETDSDRDDNDSFHDSFPASFPTEAKHGSTEREAALWLRVKYGQDTYHDNDRPATPEEVEFARQRCREEAAQ